MEDMKRTLLSALFLLLCTIVWSQSLTIQGNVTGKNDGYPIIGATVVETRMPTNGTITDVDGNFKLTVQQDAEVTISYIGYQSVTLKAQPQVNVILEEESELLQEVVVTGYTVQRKADLTGAVSVVSMDDLAKQNENNPMKALQGRVPGMNITANGNPSGNATIRIRGVGTLNNNDPLYIIDGVPTKAGMHELNGNDIETIQVLKDAASASIYGSRAANGVIIITTKKGKEGRIKIDFDASVAASMYTNKIDVLNTEEFGRVMWQAYVNDGNDPNTNGLGYKFNWGYD
ncbi:secreted protein containing TonB-dependent receptor, plug domain protein, partial [gut metagenome]